MAFKLNKLTRLGLSVNAAPYRVTLASGEVFYCQRQSEILRGADTAEIKSIYDRKRHKVIRTENIGHRKRKQKP